MSSNCVSRFQIEFMTSRLLFLVTNCISLLIFIYNLTRQVPYAIHLLVDSPMTPQRSIKGKWNPWKDLNCNYPLWISRGSVANQKTYYIHCVFIFDFEILTSLHCKFFLIHCNQVILINMCKCIHFFMNDGEISKYHKQMRVSIEINLYFW